MTGPGIVVVTFCVLVPGTCKLELNINSTMVLVYVGDYILLILKSVLSLARSRDLLTGTGTLHTPIAQSVPLRIYSSSLFILYN